MANCYWAGVGGMSFMKVWFRKNLKVTVLGLILLSACMSSLFLLPLGTRAAGEVITDDYIAKRAFYRGLKDCYNNSLNEEISLGNASFAYVDDIFSKSSPIMHVPTGFSDRDNYACKKQRGDLLSGGIPSLMEELSPISSLSTPARRDEYFEGMGFSGSFVSTNPDASTASGTECFWYEYSYGQIKNATSNRICFVSGENGEIVDVTDSGREDEGGGTFNIQLSATFQGENLSGYYSNCSNNATCLSAIISYPSQDGSGLLWTQNFEIYNQYTEEASVGDISQMFSMRGTDIQNWVVSDWSPIDSSTFNVTPRRNSQSGAGATDVDNNTYTASSNRNEMLRNAIRYLDGSGDLSLTDPFDDTELYYIYMSYLKDIYGAQIAYDYCAPTSQGDNYIPVIITGEDDSRSWQYCAIDNIRSVEDSSTKVRTGSTMDAEERASQVIDYLQAINVNNLDLNRLTESAQLDNSTVGVADPDNGESGDSSSEGGTLGEGAQVCFQAASSLGWIICPVIQGVGGVLKGIYDNVIRNQFLEVDASLLGEGNDSIYQGWATFRNIANIVFIILFILVILSQVTGVGISNYGIKKMLPRLIAVALLVNLSYIICQLAVDISNILGYGLESMFEGLSNDVPAPDTIGSFADSILTSLFSTAVSGAAAAGGIVLAISNWSYWLFPLLLFLLGCLISIIFFAIILGIRSAGILILVAVAPIAIVCYALPNLKKVFDRWLKIFSSLLLVFPLCGLLMGGGIYASRLLLSVSANADENVGFFFQLIAMLLQVVPFFFIPSLVKHSMTAIGNLGAKISGFGSKISSGAQGALRKSERVQDWNKRIRVGQQYRRAQRAMTRAEAKGKTLSPARARQIARAKAAYEKQGIEDASNRHYAGRSQAQIDAAVAAAAVAAEDKDLQDAATALETQYKKSGMDYRFDDMQQVHRDALDALMRDPTDRNAKAKLKASQNILSATDPGRARLKDNFYNASGQIQRETNQQMRSAMDSAASWAAQSLERAHGADIKAHDRSFHKYLTDQAQGISAVKGGFAAGSIGQDDRGQDIQGTRATSYDTGNISGLTAATLAGTDENALDRILQTTRNDYDPQGRLSDDDKRRFLAMSEEMFKNENIAVQPKVADKVNAIRKALGAAELEPSVRNSSSSGDSGTINVRGQATSGAPILRTGNDGQAPMPSGATMTDSGIIIGHENMSDHEIAQYAEEMQQFNTRQRQAGGQGRTGGQGQSGRAGQGGQGSQSS